MSLNSVIPTASCPRPLPIYARWPTMVHRQVPPTHLIHQPATPVLQLRNSGAIVTTGASHAQAPQKQAAPILQPICPPVQVQTGQLSSIVPVTLPNPQKPVSAFKAVHTRRSTTNQRLCCKCSPWTVDTGSKQCHILQETVTRQRELIGKLVTAIVQDRLKQPGIQFQASNLQSTMPYTDIEKLLTYTEKVSVDKRFMISRSSSGSESRAATCDSRTGNLPSANKRSRTLTNGTKKLRRKRLRRDRKTSISPVELTCSASSRATNIRSRRGSKTQSPRDCKENGDCGATRNGRDPKGSQADKELQFLRRKTLQLLSPNGDSRLFRCRKRNQQVADAQSLRQAFSQELQSLEDELKWECGTVLTASNDMPVEMIEEGTPQGDSDWSPPTAACSTEVSPSSESSSSHYDVTWPRSQRVPHSSWRPSKHRRKRYVKRTRRSWTQFRPITRSKNQRGNGTRVVKRRASDAAMKKIDNLLLRQSSDDVRDEMAPQPKEKSSDYCGMKNNFLHKVRCTRAAWGEAMSENHSIMFSRRMAKYRSALQNVSFHCRSSRLVKNSCESSIESDDEDVAEAEKQEHNPISHRNNYAQDGMLEVNLEATKAEVEKLKENQGSLGAKMKVQDDNVSLSGLRPNSRLKPFVSEDYVNHDDGNDANSGDATVHDKMSKVVTMASGSCKRTEEERIDLPQEPLRSSTPSVDGATQCVVHDVAEEIVISDVRSLVLPELSSEDAEVSQITENFVPASFLKTLVGTKQLDDVALRESPRKQLVRGFRALNESLSNSHSKESSRSSNILESPDKSVVQSVLSKAITDVTSEDFVKSFHGFPKVEDAYSDYHSVVDYSKENGSNDRVTPNTTVNCNLLDHANEENELPSLTSGTHNAEPVEWVLVPRKAMRKAKERIQEQLCGRRSASPSFTRVGDNLPDLNTRRRSSRLLRSAALLHNADLPSTPQLSETSSSEAIKSTANRNSEENYVNPQETGIPIVKEETEETPANLSFAASASPTEVLPPVSWLQKK